MKRERIAIAATTLGIALSGASHAEASPGGVEAPQSGGALAGPEHPGGVPAETSAQHAHVAAEFRYVKKHFRNDTKFRFLTLDPESSNLDTQYDSVEAIRTEGPQAGSEIVDPLVLMYEDSAKPAVFLGREGESLVQFPANEVKIVAYLGNTATAVENISPFLTPHTLHNTPNHYMGAVGFTAENGESFGLTP